jgi:hypothetical protein
MYVWFSTSWTGGSMQRVKLLCLLFYLHGWLICPLVAMLYSNRDKRDMFINVFARLLVWVRAARDGGSKRPYLPLSTASQLKLTAHTHTLSRWQLANN